LCNVHFISGEIFDVRSIFPTLFGSGVARNFRQGVRQSVAFLSVHSRSAALTKILAHPLGFTRRPITPRNHIPEICIFLAGTPLTPLLWLRHCYSVSSSSDAAFRDRCCSNLFQILFGHKDGSAGNKLDVSRVRCGGGGDRQPGPPPSSSSSVVMAPTSHVIYGAVTSLSARRRHVHPR